MIKVCYIPLGVETYTPITIDNIDSHCSYTGDIEPHDERLLNLQAIIKKAVPGLFNSNSVRVKITIMSSDSIYIDNYGGLQIGNSQSHLDPESLTIVRKILDNITSKGRRRVG